VPVTRINNFNFCDRQLRGNYLVRNHHFEWISFLFKNAVHGPPGLALTGTVAAAGARPGRTVGRSRQLEHSPPSHRLGSGLCRFNKRDLHQLGFDQRDSGLPACGNIIILV
jgi:hypothetical protein